MVNYSIDTEPRSRVHFAAALIALLFSVAVPQVLQSVGTRVLVPSAFAVYGLVLYAFNHWLRKLPLLAFLAGVPNLAGKYSGFVSRETPGSKLRREIPVTVEINQAWMKIDMVMTSERSMSNLTLYGLQLENDKQQRMLSSYMVKERRPSSVSNAYGEGAQELVIELGAKTKLSGQYYSTKGNRGFVYLEKQID